MRCPDPIPREKRDDPFLGLVVRQVGQARRVGGALILNSLQLGSLLGHLEANEAWNIWGLKEVYNKVVEIKLQTEREAHVEKTLLPDGRVKITDGITTIVRPLMNYEMNYEREEVKSMEKSMANVQIGQTVLNGKPFRKKPAWRVVTKYYERGRSKLATDYSWGCIICDKVYPRQTDAILCCKDEKLRWGRLATLLAPYLRPSAMSTIKNPPIGVVEWTMNVPSFGIVRTQGIIVKVK